MAVRLVHSLSGSVVLSDWNDDIGLHNEFRVIVAGGRIRGIAQQRWYKEIYNSDERRLETADKMCAAWSRLGLPFQDVIMDVWVDNERAHLIECNAGGCWGPSGSSLFHWLNDDVENSPEIVFKWF
jgi:hypothetical protein